MPLSNETFANETLAALGQTLRQDIADVLNIAPEGLCSFLMTDVASLNQLDADLAALSAIVEEACSIDAWLCAGLTFPGQPARSTIRERSVSSPHAGMAIPDYLKAIAKPQLAPANTDIGSVRRAEESQINTVRSQSTLSPTNPLVEPLPSLQLPVPQDSSPELGRKRNSLPSVAPKSTHPNALDIADPLSTGSGSLPVNSFAQRDLSTPDTAAELSENHKTGAWQSPSTIKPSAIRPLSELKLPSGKVSLSDLEDKRVYPPSVAADSPLAEALNIIDQQSATSLSLRTKTDLSTLATTASPSKTHQGDIWQRQSAFNSVSEPQLPSGKISLPELESIHQTEADLLSTQMDLTPKRNLSAPATASSFSNADPLTSNLAAPAQGLEALARSLQQQSSETDINQISQAIPIDSESVTVPTTAATWENQRSHSSNSLSHTPIESPSSFSQSPNHLQTQAHPTIDLPASDPPASQPPLTPKSPTSPASPAFDSAANLSDLMDAITQSVSREYGRFYGD